jgi:photosystem II stability/assembly factor-like uncharacterized protein
VFDQAGSLCIGDVTVSQSHPNIVWVGTGEHNVIRSTSCGDGVWKSTDGGKSWRHMGLKDSRHVGRIVIHPKDPDIVYVAALGHGWGRNSADRGLYKTTDGGKTWQLTKYIDDQTGFIDVAMDPADPDVLYAAAYTCQRDPFSGMTPRAQWSGESGLFKTVDGGKTWTRMTDGLPKRPIGRAGLAVYPKDSRIVYAIVQTDKTGGKGFKKGGKDKDVKDKDIKGKEAKDKDAKEQKDGKDPADGGGVFRSEDGGKTWMWMNGICPLPFCYCQIRVDPNDEQRVYVLGVQMAVSKDGGRTFSNFPTKGVHVDHRSMWINPKDSKHIVLGNDGGLYVSRDQGGAWEHIQGMAIGQFYAIGVDMRRPYRVYGGLQDNGSWGGPSATDRDDGITLADWYKVGGGDGFYCQIDPTDPDTVYWESQYGVLRRADLKATGGKGGKGLKGGAKVISPKGAKGQYRFNWNTPIHISPHDPKTLYFGGNVLFKSQDRGDKWDIISPDLTRGGKQGDTGHTITTIAESPRKAGLLWVGTDDGLVHVSTDGGKSWTDLSDRIPGPKDRWVTRVECSHHDEATAYVTIDRHRNDDLMPYVFKTTDGGKTWTSLVGNLPAQGPLHVIRESSRNRDLLFVGTEWGLFGSLDGGKTWHHVRKGIPPKVTVHDLVIHPRDRELVIGTHGRSIYVMDIAPLEELSADVLAGDVHLFDVRPAVAQQVKKAQEGRKGFAVPNPPPGATVHYYLRTPAGRPPLVTVSDAGGNKVAALDGPREAGLQSIVWDLRPSQGSKLVPPGEYDVRLTVDGQTLTRRLRVEAPPSEDRGK